jgi:hypothetical protein
VALHYGQKGSQTAFTTEWNPDDKSNPDKIVKVNKGNIFDAESPTAFFKSPDGGKTVKEIEIWVRGLMYERKNGELLTTVTLRYPDNNVNLIRVRKLVIGHDTETSYTYAGQIKKEKIKADDEEETSAIFE